MRRLAPAILAFSALVGCSAADDAPRAAATAPAEAGVPADVAAIAKGYARLIPMTNEPVLVNPALFGLCRSPSPDAEEEARRVNGPHAMTAVMVYMNEPAADAFRRSATTYPVGSTVVKEKRSAYAAAGTSGSRANAPAGVGGMVKRPAGYDPAHGDWEYFYFEDPTRIESGAIRSCAECHAGAASAGYVYGDWASGRPRRDTAASAQR